MSLALNLDFDQSNFAQNLKVFMNSSQRIGKQILYLVLEAPYGNGQVLSTTNESFLLFGVTLIFVDVRPYVRYSAYLEYFAQILSF
jgi:hypothetical protein